ncbi:MAG TPA: hypothetical protein VG365_03465 [Solirubrobacteraceae bacterium]|jgi:hypothetical protein|nr:hypothetical protein [Solirubrobacteraceae bacterium]
MNALRRKGRSAGEGEAELPRLAWPAHRDGQNLIVSVVPSRVAGEASFRPVDVLPKADKHDRDGAAAAELVSSLTRAADAAGTIAIQGFAARSPGGNVLTFTLAVSLADIPYPDAGELPEGDVSDCRLPYGPAVRIFRIAEPGTGEGAPPVPMFSTTYLAQTDFGVLALAFATPHVDGAREFAVLFESIAGSCAIQPAPSATAT